MVVQLQVDFNVNEVGAARFSLVANKNLDPELPYQQKKHFKELLEIVSIYPLLIRNAYYATPS